MVEFQASTVVAMFAAVEVTLAVLYRKMATRENVKEKFKKHRKEYHNNAD